jgi:membrane protease YdiL (CAAX protease family)
VQGTGGVTRGSPPSAAVAGRLEARIVVVVAALTVLAAFVQPARLPILAIVALGFVLLWRRRSPIAPAWAAPLPILATFAWGVVISPMAEAAPFACDSPFSAPAIARLAEAVGGIVLVLALGRLIGTPRAQVGLRWPSWAVGALSVALVVVLGPVAVLGFRSFAAPFFGAFDYAFSLPTVLVPALVFALANGTLEELVYRGAMLGWTARITGWWPAAIAQAVVFGAAHSGSGFVGSAAPVVLAMGAAGLLAAVVVRRTGSLLPVIAIHVALDVPLYLSIACRVS